MLEAFPFDTAPKYLLRDRDRIYREEFRKQVGFLESLRIQIPLRLVYHHLVEDSQSETCHGSTADEQPLLCR